MSWSIFRHAPIGALALDARGHIVEVNPTFARLAQRPSEALLGLTFADLFSPLNEAPDDFGRLGAGVSTSAEITRTLNVSDDEAKKVRITAWRNEDGIVALIDALDVHEEAAASLTQFAALVAHEIRNPLAGIGSALSVISDRLPSGGPEREVIAEIRGRLDRLIDLVDDLLLLVRPVYVRKQDAELSALVIDACRQAGHRPPAAGPLIPLHIDPNLTTRAMCSLIRYSAGSGHLNLTWRQQGDRVSVWMSGGRLASVSGEAAKAWSVRDRQDGLELPVARRIAEAQGGRLVSEVGDLGLMLRLELPVE
ncbi:MAG: histidine kinase dimerization/phospho-acceptor domain-containing protein [Myxococcota bacterium]